MKNKQGWASLHAFQLDRDSDVPLFRQLYLQARAAILSRALRPGSKLPSTRELAASNCSPPPGGSTLDMVTGESIHGGW